MGINQNRMLSTAIRHTISFWPIFQAKAQCQGSVIIKKFCCKSIPPNIIGILKRKKKKNGSSILTRPKQEEATKLMSKNFRA